MRKVLYISLRQLPPRLVRVLLVSRKYIGKLPEQLLITNKSRQKNRTEHYLKSSLRTLWTEGGASQSARSTGLNPAEVTPGYEQNKKGQGRCGATLPREKKMPNINKINGMENMVGTTQKENSEGRRNKDALLASKRKTWALQRD